MVETRTIVRVFLASPGDLKEERQLAKQIVDQFNKSWADHLGHQIELVGWEDTVSTYRRPQEAINQDLARCELFIGMMWRSWGSPSGDDFTSGFHEEFTLAERRKASDGAPEIKLLFKKIDEATEKDAGPVLQKVIQFKESVRPKILYKEFEGLDEFKLLFETCIRDYIQALDRARRQRELDARVQQASSPSDTTTQSEDSDSDGGALQKSTATFISGFVAKARRGDRAHDVTALEVARFRLIAASMGQGGNDEETIGAHDANLLYRERTELSLGDREVSSLIDAGLSHLKSENTPIWHWLSVSKERETNRLAWRALTGPTARRAGALRVMRLLGSELPVDPEVPRARYLSWLLGTDVEDEPLREALAYLAEHGRMEDLPLLEQEHLRKNSRTTTAAVVAALRIALRSSVNESLELLIRLQPETLPDDIAELLFAKPASLSAEQLKSLLSLRVKPVLKRAVGLLRQRRALSVEAATALLADDDPELRLEGLRALADLGEARSLEDAKQILVRKKQRGGLAALWRETEGDDEYEEWRMSAFAKMSAERLEEQIQSGGILDRQPWFARARADFSAHASEIRTALDDDFRAHFAEGVAAEKVKHGNAEYVGKLAGLEQFLRQKYNRGALAVLCEQNQPEDLDRVRSALRREGISWDLSDLRYLSKHGEWTDVTLLIALADAARRASNSFLGIYYDTDKFDDLAVGVAKLGKGRTAEVMAKEMPDALRTAVLNHLKDAEFASLDNAVVDQMLRSKSDDVRKAAALKAVSAWPKKRCEEFLKAYVAADGTYYYSAVFWLDAAISLSRQTARSVARMAQREHSLAY